MISADVVGEWLRQILLPGMGTLVIAALFTLLRRYIQRIDDEKLRELLSELVEAAEQIYGSGRGAEKRQFVMEQLRLQGLGSVPRHAVEAAVYDMNKYV